MLIKKLKLIFEVETTKELAEILGINPETLSKWRRKEKCDPPWPLPHNIKGLLEMIYKQQKEIRAVKKKLKAMQQHKKRGDYDQVSEV